MAKKINLNIDQGATFSSNFLIKDDSNTAINLSSYTVESKFRKSYTSSNSVSFNTSANSSGYIILSLNANATSNIVAGRYVYDVEITSSAGIVSRAVEGIVTVTPQVTK